MVQAAEHAIEWVMVRVNVAMLIGALWCEPGEEIPLPIDRAKQLKERKVAGPDGKPISTVDYNKNDIEISPMPQPKRAAGRERKSKKTGEGGNGSNDNGGGKTTDDDDPPGTGERSLDDLFSGKTLKLLQGEFSTLGELRKAVADGFDLTSISGIGDGTAESIRGQLDAEQ